jgi:hypothetical protein
MTTFPGSPRLFHKGALVSFDPVTYAVNVVVFQYNPEVLTRTLTARGASGEGARAEATRLTGAPTEEIKLDVEIDATDQLERGERLATTLGIHPQLAALEMLLYPSSASVIRNTALMATGVMEVVPPAGPMTLFIWGVKRILPVRLTEFSVVEEMHDVRLNPIRAIVSLGMRVLSYNDLSATSPGYHLFLGQQVLKETMAHIGSGADMTAVGVGALKNMGIV